MNLGCRNTVCLLMLVVLVLGTAWGCAGRQSSTETDAPETVIEPQEISPDMVYELMSSVSSAKDPDGFAIAESEAHEGSYVAVLAWALENPANSSYTHGFSAGQLKWLQGRISGTRGVISGGRYIAFGLKMNGHPIGPWTLRWASSGRSAGEALPLAARGSYCYGKRHGRWEFFYPNGSLASDGVYVQGMKDGPWVMYHETRAKWLEGRYIGDQRTGPWVEYDLDGTVVEEWTETSELEKAARATPDVVMEWSKLLELHDADGNGVLDRNEIATDSIRFYDRNGDGIADDQDWITGAVEAALYTSSKMQWPEPRRD